MNTESPQPRYITRGVTLQQESENAIDDRTLDVSCAGELSKEKVSKEETGTESNKDDSSGIDKTRETEIQNEKTN